MDVSDWPMDQETWKEEYLNYQNIKTPKGLNYYSKLVWVSLFKYRRRQKRSFKD